MPTFSYPRFVQLLKFDCYSKSVLSGLVISIGGLQDSLRKAALSALLEYLQMDEDFNNRSKEYMLSSDILWVLQLYKRCDRVIIPTLKVSQLPTIYKVLSFTIINYNKNVEIRFNVQSSTFMLIIISLKFLPFRCYVLISAAILTSPSCLTMYLFFSYIYIKCPPFLADLTAL